MKPIVVPLVALVLALQGALSAAAAQDWRYCVAQDEAARRVFVTPAFETDEPIDALERAFNHYLDAAAGNHHWGICPRAPSREMALDDIEAAARYNRMLGLAREDLGWPSTP
ncbi:MAG: hypothetical protein U1E62_19885 [Alsobacter sp.]